MTCCVRSACSLCVSGHVVDDVLCEVSVFSMCQRACGR